MRYNHENRSISRPGKADDNAQDPPTDDSEADGSLVPNLELGRRSYLGLLGGGVGTALLGTRPVVAQDGGYGAGEYGLGEYGGAENESVDPPTESPDKPDESDDDSTSDVLTVSADPKASAVSLSGLVWSLGDADEANVFFEYRAADTDEWSETEASTQSRWGAFEQTVTDLSPSTEYEYRAVVTTGDDSSTGDTKAFQTLEADQSEPSVDKLSIRDVSSADDEIELLIDWEVSDPDGDLDTVSMLVSDGNSTIEWEDIPASGSTARGSQMVSVPADADTTYKVTVSVTDGAGNRAFASKQYN